MNQLCMMNPLKIWLQRNMCKQNKNHQKNIWKNLLKWTIASHLNKNCFETKFLLIFLSYFDRVMMKTKSNIKNSIKKDKNSINMLIRKTSIVADIYLNCQKISENNTQKQIKNSLIDLGKLYAYVQRCKLQNISKNSVCVEMFLFFFLIYASRTMWMWSLKLTVKATYFFVILTFV